MADPGAITIINISILCAMGLFRLIYVILISFEVWAPASFKLFESSIGEVVGDDEFSGIGSD